MSGDNDPLSLHRRENDIQIQFLRDEISELKESIESLALSVDALNEVWVATKGAMVFMKSMTALVAVGAAAWAWISAHLTVK